MAEARPRKRAAAHDDPTARALAAHGDAFLARFDSEKPAKRPKPPPVVPRAAAPARALKSSKAVRGAEGKAAVAAAPQGRPVAADDELDALFATGAPPSNRAPAAVGQRAVAPPVQTAVFDGRHRVAVYAPGLAPPPPPAAPQPRRGAAEAPPDVVRAAEDALLFGALRDVEREVERFGAQGLDARARKAWEARRLESLGMAAAPRPRIPANIGLGMAKKQKQRQEAARLQEAAVNGSNRLAKKKKAPEKARGAAGERGVAWGGGTGDTFRGGMLRLAPPDREQRGGGERERGGAFGGAFKGTGGKRKGGGAKGKKKGSGGGKKHKR